MSQAVRFCVERSPHSKIKNLKMVAPQRLGDILLFSRSQLFNFTDYQIRFAWGCSRVVMKPCSDPGVVNHALLEVPGTNLGEIVCDCRVAGESGRVTI
jgi:hypothetical protein